MIILYGNGRIGYSNDDMYYFLGDALGSVRAVVQGDTDAPVVMTRDYAPYGEVLAGQGTNPTPYGFTGEWTDASGLVYLRARYYSPMDGRFTSKDTWRGDDNIPLSYNLLLYSYANPIMYRDPSGKISCLDEDGDGRCDDPEIKCYEFKDPITRNKCLNAVKPHFTGDIVQREKIDWLQWFGGTNTAKDKGRLFNYDGYCQGYHCGIDIGAAWATHVRSGVYGKVVSTTSEGGGKVFVRKNDYEILYQHLTDVKVTTNQLVTPDTIIAGIGNPTGNKNDGNWHVHIEVRFSSSGCGDWKDRIPESFKPHK